MVEGLLSTGPTPSSFTYHCTLVLYKQLIQTGSVLLLLQFSSVLGFSLYEDTANGRAATHQLYRGLVCSNVSDATPPTDKIHQSSKTVVYFEP